MEKLNDIHNSKKRLEGSLNQILKSSMSRRQKEKIERFILEAKMGKNAKKKVGNHRISANLQSWLILHKYFQKDFDKITDKETEKFVRDLDNDKIKRQNGEKYKASSKDEIIRGLKRYLKWLLPETKYKKKVGWIKQYEEVTEIPAITQKEAEKLSMNATSPRDRALILFLYDSGCRIEEALNLRIKDVEKKVKDNEDEFFIVDIKVSKTLPRRISIPIATPLLNEWLAEHPAITDKEAFLFPVRYDAVRIMLTRLSKKVLGYKISPHVLRHSSATHYCKKINNPYKFCYRYGWTIGSDMARRYIDRNLLGEEAQEELDNLIKADKTQELHKEVNKLKEQLKEFEEFVPMLKTINSQLTSKNL